MNKPSKSLINALDKLLRAHSSQQGSIQIKTTRSTGLFKLHDHYEFGDYDGKTLRFSSAELNALHQDFCTILGCHDVRALRDGLATTGLDRGQAAALTSAEKLASIKPSADLVQLTFADQRLTQDLLTDAMPMISQGLLINWQSLPAFEQVLVVENYDTFLQLGRYPLATELKSVPAFYRGHGSDAKNLKAYLAANPLTQIWLFADLDPKGLLLAHEFNAQGLIAPPAECWSQARLDISAWSQQHRERQQLDRLFATLCPSQRDLEPLYQLWQALKQHKIAIMQQQWLHIEARLQIYELSKPMGLHARGDLRS